MDHPNYFCNTSLVKKDWNAMQRLDEFLEMLKRKGPATTIDIARELKVSRQAALQTLQKLASERLVKSTDERRGVGRPRQVWSVSDRGLKRLPDAHAALTLDLINAARSVFGEAGLDSLIDQREAQMRRDYANVLLGAASLGERVSRLASIRTSEGYMAESTPTDSGGYLLVENHCPICAAASVCQQFCRSELEIFRSALGENVSVERTDHILAGARRCAYLITPV